MSNGAIETIIVTSILVVTICCAITFLAYLIHRSDQNETVHFKLHSPGIVPWGNAAKARRARQAVNLEEAKADLFVAKHSRMQNEMIFEQLKDQREMLALEAASQNSEPTENENPTEFYSVT